MSVIPIGELFRSAAGATKPEGFWQKLAQALDAHLVDRSRRAVPAAVLRRSRHDVARCRRLMHQRSLIAANAGSRDFSGT